MKLGESYLYNVQYQATYKFPSSCSILEMLIMKLVLIQAKKRAKIDDKNQAKVINTYG